MSSCWFVFTEADLPKAVFLFSLGKGSSNMQTQLIISGMEKALNAPIWLTWGWRWGNHLLDMLRCRLFCTFHSKFVEVVYLYFSDTIEGSENMSYFLIEGCWCIAQACQRFTRHPQLHTNTLCPLFNKGNKHFMGLIPIIFFNECVVCHSYAIINSSPVMAPICLLFS